MVCWASKNVHLVLSSAVGFQNFSFLWFVGLQEFSVFMLRGLLGFVLWFVGLQEFSVFMIRGLLGFKNFSFGFALWFVGLHKKCSFGFRLCGLLGFKECSFGSKNVPLVLIKLRVLLGFRKIFV